MRLRKNLRVWAMVLVMCMCLFAVVKIGDRVVPMLAEKEKKELLQVENTAVNANYKQKSNADTGKNVQSTNPAQRLIEGYTSDVDQSVFDETAIIGNSFVEDIKHFGLIKDANFYSSVELNVRNVKDFVSPATSLPVYRSLSLSNCKNIVFVFGHNEMGWNINKFDELFQQMLIGASESRPDAKLFVCAITPVSKDISDRAVDGSTMERVNLMNGILAKFATENKAIFVDSTVLFAGPDGYLADGASADGVSLEYKYCKAWVNHLAESVKKSNK